MMPSTRTVKIGNCTVVVNDVPDNITDEELRKAALKKLYALQLMQAAKDSFHDVGMAS